MDLLLPTRMLASALLSRCRGSQWFGHVPYTGLGRLLACVGLALVNAYSQSWLCIVLLALALLNWCVYAWDVYWASAANSGLPNGVTPAFAPADWILSKLPIQASSRLWGVIGMGLRQGICALPVFIVLTYFTGNFAYIPLALVPFLFGIPYYIASLINKSQFVMYAELAIGAIWAVLIGG